MDQVLSKNLLDFIDFHAYDTNADPDVSVAHTFSFSIDLIIFMLCVFIQSLRSAIQTADAYAQVQYQKPLPAAITESNYKQLLYPVNGSTHFYNRTFPLLLSTLALLRHPDKVISRLVYDYKVSYCNPLLISTHLMMSCI